MNKAEFRKAYFEGCRALNLGMGEVIVGGGGSMLMRGLRETTADVDVVINAIEFDRIWEKTPESKKKYIGDPHSPMSRVISITDKMDVHRMADAATYDWSRIEGVSVEPADATLKLKLFLNREKDQQDIVKLKEYIDEQKTVQPFLNPSVFTVPTGCDFDRIYYGSKHIDIGKNINPRMYWYWPEERRTIGRTMRIHTKPPISRCYPHALMLFLGIVRYGKLVVFGKSLIGGSLTKNFSLFDDVFEQYPITNAEFTQLLKDIANEIPERAGEVSQKQKLLLNPWSST